MRKTTFLQNNLSAGFIFLGVVIWMAAGCAGQNGEPEEDESSLQDTGSSFSATLIDEVRQGDNLVDEEMMEVRELAALLDESRRNAITNAVEKASPAVVSIAVTESLEGPTSLQEEFFRRFFGIPDEFTNIGSGFIISEDGLIVTNQHVVGLNATEILVTKNNGETFEAELVGSDELIDLALLKIDADRPLSFVEFSDSDEVIVGEWAIAMGNPFGLIEHGQPAVTVGVVSAKNRDFRPDPNNPRVYIDMIQTDAAINRGNSGGPLLNSYGEVIGVNTFIFTGGTSEGFVGLSFAIPSNRVERIISQLLTSGEVALDYDPGMNFTSMNEQLIRRYGLPYTPGLLVTSVNKDGPAFECGVMPGDIILSIGEERVLSEMHARAILHEYYEGDTLKVELLRDGQPYETSMLLRKRVEGETLESESE